MTLDEINLHLQQKILLCKYNNMENPGIDPGASRMRIQRSTI